MEKNPFEYGRELGLSELVDREAEMRDIEATIRNRSKLFLIGPRRYGKTSLLSAAHEAVRKHGTVVIRLDAEKYESLDLLAAAMLTVATRALQGPLEKTIGLIRDVASRLRPEFVADGENIVVRIGASPGKSELPLLTEGLEAVERLAERTEKQVVVILDEVQQIVVEHGITAERQLRSVVQTHRHVGYIFAGSDTRLLTAMTQDADRPFHRLGTRVYLGPLPRRAFLDFLHRIFESSGIEVEQGAAERILELAEQVPYNVQRLAHEVWEIARSGGLGHLTVDLVDDALYRGKTRHRLVDPFFGAWLRVSQLG